MSREDDAEHDEKKYDYLQYVSQELEGALGEYDLHLPNMLTGRINVDLDVTRNPHVLHIGFPRRLKPSREDKKDAEFCRAHDRMVHDGTMEKILKEIIRNKNYELTPCSAKRRVFSEREYVSFTYSARNQAIPKTR
ncbi:hypothetical protein FJZ19_05620 [Candidatus Pacearchaeota archaeon]|nr:hypothetical protein [Candidatus Pacearchaeota archaeon]